MLGSREEGAVVRDLALMWHQLASGGRLDAIATRFNVPLEG